jgi:hypothetical protein
MDRGRNIFSLIILLFAFTTGKNRRRSGAAGGEEAIQNSDTLHNWSMKNPEEGSIENVSYNRDGITAQYPKLVSGGSKEDLELWNRIIYEDLQEIINIYSYQPFPELKQQPSDITPASLIITYQVMLHNNHFLSIRYMADYRSPYSAYPTVLVYTTNIDKQKGERIKLPDLVNIDRNFVQDFRSWDFIASEPESQEFSRAVKEYVDHISDEDLISGFETADIIGSGNHWGIYSYLTPDRLGISLGVPNYIGDHVEFEREYTRLGSFMKGKM